MVETVLKACLFSGLVGMCLSDGEATARVALRASAAVNTGVTDNADQSPKEAPTGSTSGRVGGDGFTEVTPSLRLDFASARLLQRLSYSLAAVFYYRSEGQDSLAHRVEWLMLLPIAEGLRLTVAADGSLGRQNSAFSLAAASSSDVGARASGDARFTSANLEQSLDWDLHPRWTLTQAAAVHTFVPLGGSADSQQWTFEAEGAATLTRRAERGSLALRLAHSYARSSGILADDLEMPARQVPSRQVMVTTLAPIATFELSEDWAVELLAGVLRAAEWLHGDHQFFHPTAAASIRYQREDGGMAGELSVRHVVEQNLLVAELYATQQARLRVRLPLGRDRRATWTIEGTAGYDHAQRVDLATHTIGAESLHVGLADLAVTWRMSRYVDFAARYQFTQQTGLRDDPNVLPFSRHLALVGMTVRYPGSRQPERAIRDRLRRLDREQWAAGQIDGRDTAPDRPKTPP